MAMLSQVQGARGREAVGETLACGAVIRRMVSITVSSETWRNSYARPK